MQKVLTAAQMREVDRLTTEKYGIPSIILMENAAHAVARVITEKLGGSVKGKSILILCGKGNNGGDGAALARILMGKGAFVDVFLFGKVEKTRGDARTNFEILRKTTFRTNSREGVEEIFGPYMLGFEEVGSIREWVNEYSMEPDPDCVVDALFGTGLSGELDSDYRLIFDAVWFRPDLQESDHPILRVAIDIPSGLQSDTERLGGVNSTVDVTVTFTAPKIANVLPEASNYNGEVVVESIGSPHVLVGVAPSNVFVTELDDAAEFLRTTRFETSSYKNKRGHAFLIAGSEDYSGAAVLAGNSAMRSGVGLVTLAAPKECKTEIASRLLPDVILKGIDTESDSQDLTTKANAIAIGCGLDATDPAIETLVRNIVATREVPVIIDAGALWFYSPMQKPAHVSSPHVSKGSSDRKATAVSPNWPPADAGSSDLILTPHEGEFLRLLGTDDKDAIKDRVAAVRDFATKNNVILVLKGERVLIGEPTGKVVVNPTGNSGLGKAGNGDTLTGILAGFVAQANAMKIDIFETVVAAVYVAGMAGDIAEKKFGKRVMTASDVRECLTDAFTELSIHDNQEPIFLTVDS